MLQLLNILNACQFKWTKKKVSKSIITCSRSPRISTRRSSGKMQEINPFSPAMLALMLKCWGGKADGGGLLGIWKYLTRNGAIKFSLRYCGTDSLIVHLWHHAQNKNWHLLKQISHIWSFISHKRHICKPPWIHLQASKDASLHGYICKPAWIHLQAGMDTSVSQHGCELD